MQRVPECGSQAICVFNNGRDLLTHLSHLYVCCFCLWDDLSHKRHTPAQSKQVCLVLSLVSWYSQTPVLGLASYSCL